MSEEDVREGLRAAVSDEPPLNFDPAVLVTTARQRATRRKALVAVGTATVAIAVAAVAIPATLGGGTTPAANQPPSTQAPATSTSVPATWPPSDVAAVDYTADQLRARGEEMRGHMKVVVPAVLPAWAPGVTELSPTTVCESQCELLGERDDGTLVAKLENFDAGQKINTVYHFRNNGSIVQIAAYNYDMTGVQKVLPTIPVTVDQLTRLAIDPKLGL